MGIADSLSFFLNYPLTGGFLLGSVYFLFFLGWVGVIGSDFWEVLGLVGCTGGILLMLAGWFGFVLKVVRFD